MSNVNLHLQHGCCHGSFIIEAGFAFNKIAAVALLRPEFKDMVTIKRYMICKITALLT